MMCPMKLNWLHRFVAKVYIFPCALYTIIALRVELNNKQAVGERPPRYASAPAS